MHLCISSLAVLWLSGAALAVAQSVPEPTKVPGAAGDAIPRRTLHLEKADLSSVFDAALNGLEFYFPDQSHVGLQGIKDRR